MKIKKAKSQVFNMKLAKSGKSFSGGSSKGKSLRPRRTQKNYKTFGDWKGSLVGGARRWNDRMKALQYGIYRAGKKAE
tara:strand:+ start:903 stop:1136 length:234 start_codon:yes stop_codon:yes gene_type:complete